MKNKIDDLIKKYEEGVERLNEASKNLITEPRALTNKEWESLIITTSMVEATNKIINELKEIIKE